MNKKPAKNRRTRTVKVSLTPAEYQQLCHQAQRTGGKLATYCRQQTLHSQASPTPALAAPQLSELRQLRSALGRIGNNLNQIAHHLNQGHCLSPAQSHPLSQQLQQHGIHPQFTQRRGQLSGLSYHYQDHYSGARYHTQRQQQRLVLSRRQSQETLLDATWDPQQQNWQPNQPGRLTESDLSHLRRSAQTLQEEEQRQRQQRQRQLTREPELEL